jgi:hypothetical protein
MVEPMVSATAFSKAAGVHLTAVTAAIKQGRLQAYGKSGRRVSASFRGPKFLKLDEARQSFDESRIRLDGSFLAKVSEKSGPPRRDLLAARTRTAGLQAELLEMRLAREQGEAIPRAAAIAAVEVLARAIQLHRGVSGWAEGLVAAERDGGLAAVSARLRALSAELGDAIGNLIAAFEAELIEEPGHDG